VNTSDRERPISDGEGDPFGGTRTAITSDENAGARSFERLWSSTIERPFAGRHDVRARNHKSLPVF